MKNRSIIVSSLVIALVLGACSGGDLLEKNSESPSIDPLTTNLSEQSDPPVSAPERLILGAKKESGNAQPASSSGDLTFGQGTIQGNPAAGASKTTQTEDVNLADLFGDSDDFQEEVFSPVVEEEVPANEVEVQQEPGDTVEQALSLYESGEKTKGLDMLKRLHKAGNAGASHELGIFYYNIGNIGYAPKLARNYLLAAASVSGYEYSGQALYQTALLSLRQQDYTEALSLASEALDKKGEGDAARLILNLLKSQRGFNPQDERQTSSSWFKRDKENGQLGHLYHLYLAQHPELSTGEREAMRTIVRQQYRLGAGKGNAYQQYCLARAYLEGDLFNRSVASVRLARSLATSAYRKVQPNQGTYREKYSKKFVADVIDLYTEFDKYSSL